MQLTRRAALRLIFNGAAGALLAGCGGTAASSPAPVTSAPSSARPTGPASSVGAAGGATVQPASAAAAAKPPAPPASSLESAPPKAGGTLRIGQVGDIPTLDGHSATGLVAQTVALAYDKVLGYDDKLQPIGVLAESWDLAPDYKSIKLSLRKGVTFHNGREFTADDLKYNLLRVRMPAVAAQAAGLALQSAWFTGIDTPDKYTVVLTSDKPRLGTYDFLTGLNILDKDVMEGPDAKTKINGTGPFKFGEWVTGDHISMARNANWWRAGKPYLDGLLFGIFKDPAAMVAQFEAGAQDVAYSPSLADGQRLQASGKYTGVFNAQQGAFFYISANTTKAPMDNKLFRQALQWAIDRERIASTTLHGLVGPGLNLPWPAYSPAYEAPKNQTYTFNLEKAAALVKQAGADGASFDITYNTTGFGDEYANMAQIIQADLAKIGVKTALKGLDGPTFNTQGLQLSYNGLRIAANAGAGAYDASTVFQGGGAFNFQSNFAGFKDPTYADLVMQAGTEPDTAKRKALYSKLNDYVLDQSFTYVLSASPSIIVTAPKVHALQFQQSGPLSYSEAWIQ